VSHRNIRDDFEFTIKFPSRLKDMLFWILAIIYGIILFGIWTPGAALWLTVISIIYGIIMGKFWTFISRLMRNYLIISPLRARVEENREPNLLQRFYLKNLLTKGTSQSYLQVRTVDRDISDFRSIFSEFGRVVFSFLAIMVTITRYLVSYIYGTDSVKPDQLGGSLIIGFVLAFPILGLYLPFSMVIEDARLMSISQDGSVEFMGGRVRRLIDGFFGVTGLLSGYSLLDQGELSLAGEIFVYAAILILVVLLAIPIIFPTLYIYYRQHAHLVNDFRREAMKLKIYPAKTEAQRLTGDEIKELVIGDDEEPKQRPGLLSRVSTFFTGKRTIKTSYSEDQINELTLHGAWLCTNCQNVNTAIGDGAYCTECGQIRVEKQPTSE